MTKAAIITGDSYYTYMVECSDGSLYTGYTNDLDNRIKVHNLGKGAKYTRSRLPVRLVYYEVFDNKNDAMKRECAIKKLSREAKLALIKTGESKMGSLFFNVDTIIFDMDGTVLNTLDDLTVSMNYVMDKFGFPPHSKEDYRHAFGNGIRYALEETVPKETTSEVIDRMIPVFKEHYDVHCLDRTKPYDGISELMKQLKERGYKLAIVSNKIDSAVKELNERFFDGLVEVAIGEKQGIKRKPAPDTVFEALKELGSKAENAVYVGDSEVDYETAKNSSLPCISVLWGFRDKAYLEKKGASIFAEAPGDILTLL